MTQRKNFLCFLWFSLSLSLFISLACVGSLLRWCHFEWAVIAEVLHKMLQPFLPNRRMQMLLRIREHENHPEKFPFSIHSSIHCVCVQFCWFFYTLLLMHISCYHLRCMHHNLCSICLFFRFSLFFLHFALAPALAATKNSFFFSTTPRIVPNTFAIRVLRFVHTIYLCENHCRSQEKKTTATLESPEQEQQKLGRRYFRWRMLWMCCKFGKLMMWIKEMQKCDRYIDEQKPFRKKCFILSSFRSMPCFGSCFVCIVEMH